MNNTDNHQFVFYSVFDNDLKLIKGENIKLSK
jgi:hypothetical protein